jgi:hypothetical protein
MVCLLPVTQDVQAQLYCVRRQTVGRLNIDPQGTARQSGISSAQSGRWCLYLCMQLLPLLTAAQPQCHRGFDLPCLGAVRVCCSKCVLLAGHLLAGYRGGFAVVHFDWCHAGVLFVGWCRSLTVTLFHCGDGVRGTARCRVVCVCFNHDEDRSFGCE